MTLHLGRYFGAKISIDRGSDNNRYLCAVIWYPKSSKRLGYWYPSIRWF